MKLIFKTKEQERDFVRTLIKMDKFHIFSTGRHSNTGVWTASRFLFHLLFLTLFDVRRILQFSYNV